MNNWSADDLVHQAHEVADQLTRLTLPQEMIDAGYRFVFNDSPLPVHRDQTWQAEHEDQLRAWGVDPAASAVHDEHVPSDEGLVAYSNTMADDQKAVEAGMVSPASFHETWACWPRLTFEVHQIWCGRKHEDAADTGYPTWYACTEWQAVR